MTGQKSKTKDFNNIYQQLVKKIENQEGAVVLLGLSSIYWTVNDYIIWEWVENLMRLNTHKLLYYGTVSYTHLTLPTNSRV